MKKRNIRLVLEYDGTSYFGWQLQKSHKSIQGELQRAVQEVTGKKVVVAGAGRTDAGVHAEGQVANFHTVSGLSCRKLVPALNAHLPEDIAVRSAEEVPLEFHSQFDAHDKTYRYVILNRSARSAVRRTYAQLVKPPLNADLMAAGAKHLVGTHDFRSFGTEMSKKKNTVRTIREFSVTRVEEEIYFQVTGDGFLYNQVRSMVGTLLEVGFEKHPPQWIEEVLNARDRKQAGPNVSSKGLTMVEVRYNDSPKD